MKLMKKDVRKPIKKIAFEDPKGSLALGFVFLIFIASFISFLLMLIGRYLDIHLNTTLYDGLISLITIVLVSPLILNYAKMLLMNCRDEIYDIKDLFIFNKNSFKFLKYYAFVNVLYFVVSYLLNLGSFVFVIINFALFIFLVPVFFVMPFVFNTDDFTFKEFVCKSFKIVKKKRVQFYGMILSFSWWFILGIFTLGILYLWLIPYLSISLSYLYLSFTKEKEFKKEKCLNNIFVIIIFVSIILFISILTFTTVKGSFDSFKNSLGIYTSEKTSNSLSYGSLKVKFFVPKDYKISSSTSTSKTYLKNDSILQYSIYLSDTKAALEMDKEIVEEYKNSSEYKKVSDEEFMMKVNNENITCYKFELIKPNGDISSTVMAYVPKNSFVLVISLISDKKINKNDIKKIIAIQ